MNEGKLGSRSRPATFDGKKNFREKNEKSKSRGNPPFLEADPRWLAELIEETGMSTGQKGPSVDGGDAAFEILSRDRAGG
jgi:hypothetical protein